MVSLPEELIIRIFEYVDKTVLTSLWGHFPLRFIGPSLFRDVHVKYLANLPNPVQSHTIPSGKHVRFSNRDEFSDYKFTIYDLSLDSLLPSLEYFKPYIKSLELEGHLCQPAALDFAFQINGLTRLCLHVSDPGLLTTLSKAQLQIRSLKICFTLEEAGIFTLKPDNYPYLRFLSLERIQLQPKGPSASLKVLEALKCPNILEAVRILRNVEKLDILLDDARPGKFLPSSPISSLKHLTYSGLNHTTINLADFPNIEAAEIDDVMGLDTSDALSLRSLNIFAVSSDLVTPARILKSLRRLGLGKFSQQHVLDILLRCEQLEVLSLQMCDLASLSFGPSFHLLKTLIIEDTPLKHLDRLELPYLELLILDGCPKLTAIDLLSGCGSLKKLVISQSLVEDLSCVQGLSSLEHLVADFNRIQSLSALEGLDKLSLLQIGNNRIEGCMDLPLLPSLKSLSSYYGLKITLITGLEKLPNLKLLGLGHCPIKHLDILGKSSALTFLDLSNSGLELLDGFEDWTCLESLHLNSNELTSLDGLKNMKKLRLLCANNNRISRIDGLDSLALLRSLDLSSNPITSLEGLEGLKLLETLDLDKTEITTLDGDAIRGLDKLDRVNISKGMLSKVINVHDLPMSQLNLAHNEIEDVNQIHDLENLQILDLSSNNVFVPLSTFGNFPRLYFFKFHHNLVGVPRSLLPSECYINQFGCPPVD